MGPVRSASPSSPANCRGRPYRSLMRPTSGAQMNIRFHTVIPILPGSFHFIQLTRFTAGEIVVFIGILAEIIQFPLVAVGLHHQFPVPVNIRLAAYMLKENVFSTFLCFTLY